MTISRRLAPLEARHQRQAIRALAERIATESGIPVAKLWAEAERAAARCAEIGDDAFLAELAAERGIPVAEMIAEAEAVKREMGGP